MDIKELYITPVDPSADGMLAELASEAFETVTSHATNGIKVKGLMDLTEHSYEGAEDV